MKVLNLGGTKNVNLVTKKYTPKIAIIELNTLAKSILKNNEKISKPITSITRPRPDPMAKEIICLINLLLFRIPLNSYP